MRSRHSGIGFPVGAPGEVVPIVPAAVLFDLGRGGSFAPVRDPSSVRRRWPRRAPTVGDARLGLVGAGMGAVTSGIRGGLGIGVRCCYRTVRWSPPWWSPTPSVPRSITGPASCSAPATLAPDDFPGLTRPAPEHRDAVLSVIAAAGPAPRTAPVMNTSIGVVATSATLTKTQCSKLAAIAHDGLARALNPVHTAFDGDTLFAVSTAGRPGPRRRRPAPHPLRCSRCGHQGAGRGLLAAASVKTPGGSWSSYLDLAPSALVSARS